MVGKKNGKSQADDVVKFLEKHHIHHNLISAYSHAYGYRTYHLKQAYKSLVEDDSMQNRAYWMIKLAPDSFDSLHHNYPWCKDMCKNREAEELLLLVEKKKWDKEKFVKAFEEATKIIAKDKDEDHDRFTKDKDRDVKDLLDIE